MTITKTVQLVVAAFAAVFMLLFFAPIEFLPTTSVAEMKNGTHNVQHGFPQQETTGQEHLDYDGCGLAHADTRSVATWSRFSENEVHSFLALKECVRRTFLEKGDDMTHLLSLRKIENLAALRCHQNISQSTIESIVKQGQTIWFIGDSILQQQFYVFLCMVHPTLELHEIKYTSQWPGSPLETIAAQFTYKHSIGNRSTKIIYSKFGPSWHIEETNLYVDAFPKAVAVLTEKDSIILDASAHYQSEAVRNLTRALHYIGNQSLYAKASIFYMEPTPEEWPTSNGQFTKGCWMYCTCETLNADRLLGRGRLDSDPHGPSTSFMTHNQVPTDFFGKLYPDLVFTNNNNNNSNSTESLCVPDCLPATWRIELARSIFATTTIENNHRVPMVPLWHQLVGRLSAIWPVGDCTHKSLEAVWMMNHQLLRSMLLVQRNSSKSQVVSTARLNKGPRKRRHWPLANWKNLSHLLPTV
jgi:hypothetical protein